ncbi:unnamed protein product [Gordionus sp. m RMFG-2023]
MIDEIYQLKKNAELIKSVHKENNNKKLCLGTTTFLRSSAKSKFISPFNSNNSDKNINDRHDNKSPNNKEKNDSNNNNNVDPKLIEMIENEIIDKNLKVTWDDIAGLDFVKSVIKEIIIWPLLRPDIFTGLRKPAKGILLFGPPGTGKTLIAKCIASFCNDLAVNLSQNDASPPSNNKVKNNGKMTFFNISSSVLLSKWVGESEKLVRALFETATIHAPSLIFIDEVDSILCSRNASNSSSSDTSDNESSNRLKTEFLIRLDGLYNDNINNNIIFIGATNRPQKLDEAVRRRFVKRLYIPLPDQEARLQIIQNLMRDQSHVIDETSLLELSGQKTEGYSGADMAELCREASLGPIRCLSSENIQTISLEEVGAIMLKHFDMALNRVKPSVSSEDINIYIEWNRTFGCQ